jgi:hypothetical protein
VIPEIRALAKAGPSIISNEEGRQMVRRDEQPLHTFASIRLSLDPGSNVNEESE